MSWRAVVLVVIPIAALALAAATLGQFAYLAATVWMVVFFPMLMFGLGDCLWYTGADLRIDNDGLFFGNDKPRKTPPSVSYTARTPYVVPRQALGCLTLVNGHSAARKMRKAAIPDWGCRQPTVHYGYFAVRLRRTHLVVNVTCPPSTFIPAVPMGSSPLNRGRPMRDNDV